MSRAVRQPRGEKHKTGGNNSHKDTEAGKSRVTLEGPVLLISAFRHSVVVVVAKKPSTERG